MPGSRGSGSYFGPGHPVAEIARRQCRMVHPEFVALVPGRACGGCWEYAVRNDERVVVLFDLPREVTPDPAYVDEIAVERACGGERVSLTVRERGVAARRLRAAGLSVNQVVNRLRMAAPLVHAATTPYVVESAALVRAA